MSEAYRYIKGQKVQVPLTTQQANQLGWVSVLPGVSVIDMEEIKRWCNEHIEDKLYFAGFMMVWFKRERDRTLFILKYGVS